MYRTWGVPDLGFRQAVQELAVILTKLDQTSSSSALLEMSDRTENVLYSCYILPRLNEVHYTKPACKFTLDSPGTFISPLEMNADELQCRECGEMCLKVLWMWL